MIKSTDGKKADIKKETIEPAVQAFNNALTTHEGIVAAFEKIELERSIRGGF